MNDEMKKIRNRLAWILGICFVLYMLIAAYGALYPKSAVELECEKLGVKSYEGTKECVELIERRDELKRMLKELRELRKPKGIEI